MLKDTLQKFGYPDSLIKEYENWLLLLRPKQVTLGSLILICKEDVDAFSKISEASFIEFGSIIKEIENKLKKELEYKKINYLMLMMKDPEVHFHIFPRYSKDKEFDGVVFTDKAWPLGAKMDIANEVDGAVMQKLKEKLKNIF
jgi:diadenosine tetraphosphate (Ap4A) HIT family hydrolase